MKSGGKYWRKRDIALVKLLCAVLIASSLTAIAIANDIPRASAIPWSAPTLVQQNSAIGSTGSATIAVAFTTSNLTVGNLIVVGFAFDLTNTSSGSCSDSVGDVFQNFSIYVQGTDNQGEGYCAATATSASKPNVTVTFGASSTKRGISISEFSGVTAVAENFRAAQGTAGAGTTDSVTSLALSTSTANDLVMGIIRNTSGLVSTTATGTGFTAVSTATITTSNDFRTEYKVMNPAGSVAATATFGSARTWLAYAIAFRPKIMTPTYVQGASTSNDTTATSIAQAFGSNVTNGNTIVAAVSWGSNATLTCSDSQGNSYTTAIVEYDSTNAQSLGVCWAGNTVAGATTVTATFSSTATKRRLLVHEYAGIAFTDAVDVLKSQSASASTAADNVTSTATATTLSGDLIFGVAKANTGTTTISAGTNFTQRTTVATDTATEDLTQSSSGSIAATQTFGTARSYSALMVTFKSYAASPSGLVAPPATNVYGQSGSYTTGSSGTTSSSLWNPHGVTVDTVHHRLFVSEFYNNRISVFNLDSSNNMTDDTADYVIGQPNFTTSTSGSGSGQLWNPVDTTYDSANDRLYVSDFFNSRIYIYNTSTITNGMAPSFVLGQTALANTGGSTTQTGLFGQKGMALDSVNNRLYVADASNNRVMVWNVSSLSNGKAAAFVLGQSSYTASGSAASQSGMNNPHFVSVDTTNNRLYVSDKGNNRVLVFDTTSLANGMNASYVLGQPDFTSSGVGNSQSTFTQPTGLAIAGSRLYVADSSNNRVMGFDTTSLSNGMNASWLIGQDSYLMNASNLTRTGLQSPFGLYFDSGARRLWLAGWGQNRVLTYDVNNAPNAPSSLAQFKSNGSTSIATGGWNNSTTGVFSGTVSDTDATDTDSLCVEVQPINVAFTNTETACGSAVTQGNSASVTISTLGDGTYYHWQARTKDAVGDYSGWTAYGANSDALIAATDFSVDATAPTLPASSLGQFKSDGTTPIPGTTLYNFDSTLQGWGGFTGTASGAVDTTTKRTGAGSLKVTIPNQQSVWFDDETWSTRDLSANGYTFSTWVYLPATNTGTNWRAQFQIYDSAGQAVNGSYSYLTSGKWAYVSTTVAPSLAAAMQSISLYVEAQDWNATGTNYVYVDDVQQGNGIWTPQTTVDFKGTITDASTNVALCVEKKPIGTGFSNVEDSCASLGSSGVTSTLALSSIAIGQYHWQARALDGAGNYSSWVSFGGNSDTVTSSPDFGVDNTTPTSGAIYDGTTVGVESRYNNGSLSSLPANWSFSDTGSGAGYYSYSIGTTAGGSDVLSTSYTTSANVTATGLNLRTSQIYYVSVTAYDIAGNASSTVTSTGQNVAPTLTFTLSSSSLTFNNLNSGNSFTNTMTINVTTSTNAYNGYVVRQWKSGLMSTGAKTISDYAGTYAAPTTWSGTGFGYTSSDTSIQGSGNLFSSGTKYAALASGIPGDIVADHTSTVTGTPISAESFTLTYRLTVPSNQVAGTYTTSLKLGATASF